MAISRRRVLGVALTDLNIGDLELVGFSMEEVGVVGTMVGGDHSDDDPNDGTLDTFASLCCVDEDPSHEGDDPSHEDDPDAVN